MLDGPTSQIVDPSNHDTLASFSRNQGSFTIQGGRDFTTTGDFSHVGTLSVGAGSTFTFAGGTVSAEDSSLITGAGTVAFAAGTATLAGRYDLAGTTAVTGGSVFFASPVESVGNTLTISGGLIDFSGGAPVPVNAMTFSGGTPAGSDPLLVTGPLSLSGDAEKLLDGLPVTLFGTTDWTDDGSGRLSLANDAMVTNAGGAVFDVAGDHELSGSGTFDNGGNRPRIARHLPPRDGLSERPGDVWQGTIVGSPCSGALPVE